MPTSRSLPLEKDEAVREVSLHFEYSSATLQPILSILRLMKPLHMRILRIMHYSLCILSPRGSFYFGGVGLSSFSPKLLSLWQAKAVTEGGFVLRVSTALFNKQLYVHCPRGRLRAEDF